MKIFNFGLPRTGTSSFHRFLLINKIKSVHTNDGLIDYIYPIEYNKFKNGDKSILDYFIYKNDAFSDLPWYSLSEEVIKKYKKDSVFFVTIRDPKSWVKSIRKIHHHMFSSEEISNYHYNFFEGLISKEKISEDDKLIKFYNKHNENLIYLSKKYNIKINFLKLEDTKSIIEKLMENLDINSEQEYPGPEKQASYFL